ncbi:MAG: aerobic-type carbon monoxide dehydrogenase, large subunit CoxL/CutL-like protein [Gemmatimonadetes bacterium]|nr:aerobic-type carbon monoxide dehydrogenase, large subunit CoxL/CutL-like protein [Gemmatimonadota bacterium]
MSADNPTRRDFMRASIAAGAGLTLAVYLPGCSPRAAVVSGPPFVPNAWLRIGTDGVVTVVVDKSEMGQGVLTSLPQMIMEELDGDWATVRIEEAPAGPQYVNPAFGLQGTGGSTSVRVSMMPLREAGAKARAMLVAAAAQKWGIAPDACSTANGYVLETGKRRKLGYGELTVAAAAMPVPEKVTLKDPKDFKLIGKPVKRLDLKGKVNGTAGFGIDAHTDGVLIAVVARSPVLGSSVTGFDDKPALAVPGVKRVVQVDSGVAVVATGYWAAMKGREALQVSWSKSPMAGVSSADLSAKLKALSAKPGVKARHDGDPAGALRRASKRVEATYEVPYLAHATMEPMNCTAWVQADKCTIWAPTQFQSGGGLGVQGIAAKLTGLPESAVTVHTTFLGGGFGRRFELDFVIDAVQVSKAVGEPVKVIWSREDDVRHDYFRPASYSKLAAGLDASGKPVAWSQTIVCPSIMSRFTMVFGPLPNGLDASSVEGAANIAYAIPNLHCGWVNADLGVPIGFWRSVGNSQNAFVAEGFMDEVAHAAGADPYEFRRNLLASAPRHRGVLELAATKAGWGTPLPQGRARGIAVVESFGSYVAEVAEVSIENGKVRVHRVVCAVDCGVVVNPDIIAAQMESAVVYGLTAALYGKITLENGAVVQGNFDSYPMLRMNEMPVVEVHIVPSTEGPGGVGEPGTPPIAPAVVNAIFALTGQRIRTLPIVLQGQSG